MGINSGFKGLNIGCAENRNVFVDSATVPTRCPEWDRMDAIRIEQRSSVITVTSLHDGESQGSIIGGHGPGPPQSLLSNEYFGFFAMRYSRRGGKLNPLKPELYSICYLLALLGAHHFLHVSRIRVKSLTFRLLMSYIYGAPILDVSRSHTTTQDSR